MEYNDSQNILLWGHDTYKSITNAVGIFFCLQKQNKVLWQRLKVHGEEEISEEMKGAETLVI